MELSKDAHSHHISQQFNSELEQLKNHLLEMGGLVERQVGDAINSLVNADSELAVNVRATDKKINQMEMNIDEECTRIIARRQPAASDLRLVITASKIISDLERIGDESAKVARQAIKLCEEGESPRGYVEIRHIGGRVQAMTRNALTAFARLDAEAALAVAREDKNVDMEYESAMREMVTYMMEDPRSIKRVMNVIWSLRALERIGDHARNIAEGVIYLVKGKDVRHLSLDEMQREVQGS
ncbi:MAG: phosphate signaling complex protein PhoU [Bermanella sp.]